MMTTKKSDSGLHDPYTDQLAAARYRAERDQAREELAKIREDRSWDARADAGMLGAKEGRRAVEWVREHGGLESVEARLMPEGYEWPRFEDGGPVKIGDEFAERVYGDPCRVGHFAINKYAFLIFDEEDMNHNEAIDHGTNKRVKRPAPKALDADGAEIRVGDTVYDTELANGDKFTVESIDKNGDVTAHGNKYILTQRSVAFTHRAPVLAADGKPLRAREMVYSTENGAGFTVIAVDEGSADVHVKWGYDFEDKTGTIAADQLTHEQPDSWEQLEEDARKKLDDGLHENDEWVLDLVRRAKKLAGDAE